MSSSREPARPFVVLQVDDDAVNRELMRQVLELRPGIVLEAAGLGREALAAARERPPDLVLLDLRLPDMLGDAVLAALRADPRTAGVPVVVVTADDSQWRAQHLRAAGATDYLVKPFDIGAFLTMIDGLRSKRRGPDDEPEVAAPPPRG